MKNAFRSKNRFSLTPFHSFYFPPSLSFPLSLSRGVRLRFRPRLGLRGRRFRFRSNFGTRHLPSFLCPSFYVGKKFHIYLYYLPTSTCLPFAIHASQDVRSKLQTIRSSDRVVRYYVVSKAFDCRPHDSFGPKVPLPWSKVIRVPTLSRNVLRSCIYVVENQHVETLCTLSSSQSKSNILRVKEEMHNIKQRFSSIFHLRTTFRNVNIRFKRVWGEKWTVLCQKNVYILKINSTMYRYIVFFIPEKYKIKKTRFKESQPPYASPLVAPLHVEDSILKTTVEMSTLATKNVEKGNTLFVKKCHRRGRIRLLRYG